VVDIVSFPLSIAHDKRAPQLAVCTEPHVSGNATLTETAIHLTCVALGSPSIHNEALNNTPNPDLLHCRHPRPRRHRCSKPSNMPPTLPSNRSYDPNILQRIREC